MSTSEKERESERDNGRGTEREHELGRDKQPPVPSVASGVDKRTCSAYLPRHVAIAFAKD
eukprot:1879410-Pleurochrysis_carterae.AAC.2